MPARARSTFTRAPERILLSTLSPAFSALPLGFFGLAGDHTLSLVALKAGILAQCCAHGKSDFGLTGRFLVVGLALYRGAQRDHFAGVFIDQNNVIVCRDFLLTAVVSPRLGSLLGALPSSLAAVDEQIGCLLVDQLTAGNCFAIVLRRHVQISQCALQHRQPPVNPIINLRLPESKLQAVPGLQPVSLLINQNEQQLVFNRPQRALGTATELALAVFPSAVGSAG